MPPLSIRLLPLGLALLLPWAAPAARAQEAPATQAIRVAQAAHSSQSHRARDAAPAPQPPVRGGAPAAGAPRTITWEELVPSDWDPFKDFKGLDLNKLDDGDPRAAQYLARMREVWDNAPTNARMVGQQVRLPGFVVPLEDSKEGLKEFLLVPYFGACIHSPPPPANQIVHVLPRSPVKGFRSMDTVWVSGPLATVRTESYLGASGYRIEATEVVRYQPPGR